MEQAAKGIITKAMQIVARDENVPVEWLRKEIENGRIVIPQNTNHKLINPKAIGNQLTTKINANIGTSPSNCHPEEELEKLKVALKYGADAIMDLSTGGNLHQILKNVLNESSVMVGTVPIYSVAAKYLKKSEKDITKIDFNQVFDEIEYQAELGVDFMTLHCGITQRSLSYMSDDERTMGIVSRGGSIIKAWMMLNKAENPLYEQFDRILDICRKYDVTISLGDGLRPGAICDASDRGQMAELLTLGELVDRTRERGVQVIVEGPGHVPLDQIEMNVKIMKSVCHQAPFYVLGPLPTDIAPGYDHIVGAIGGAIAAWAGADFLCYVTPAEHLSLPNIDDVKEGVIASKIAAHCADIAKKAGNAVQKDFEMANARKKLDWDNMYRLAIDPFKARGKRNANTANQSDYCSMCGNLCAIKIDNII
jgi:phosphomethylpyrimidine synthase